MVASLNSLFLRVVHIDANRLIPDDTSVGAIRDSIPPAFLHEPAMKESILSAIDEVLTMLAEENIETDPQILMGPSVTDQCAGLDCGASRTSSSTSQAPTVGLL